MKRKPLLEAVLVIHLTAALVHGGTHALVPVPLTQWQNVLIAGSVFVGPFVGVILARRGHSLGLPLFTVSMVVAFVVGTSLHFIVDNPDHIHAIPDGEWRLPFRATAGGVSVTPALGTIAGVHLWRTRRRTSE